LCNFRDGKVIEDHGSLALVAALREGERDVDAGRVLTNEEMRAKWLAGDSEGT
jgi:predicted transcriptional regulator